MLRLLAVLICALPMLAPSQEQSPTVSDQPLNPDQIAIYRAFLRGYNNGSGDPLNVATKTVALRLEEDEQKGCLKGIVFEDIEPAAKTVHVFRAENLQAKNVRLVEPDAQTKIVEENDPQRLVHAAIDGRVVSDRQLDEAVTNAFRTALLQVSEIAFDKTGRFAVMQFSFYCGSLCGHGGTLVFEKRKGRWRQTKRECGGWVS